MMTTILVLKVNQQSPRYSYITTYPSLNQSLATFREHVHPYHCICDCKISHSHLLSNRVLQMYSPNSPTTSLGNLPLVYSVPPPETANRFLNTAINVSNPLFTFCLL